MLRVFIRNDGRMHKLWVWNPSREKAYYTDADGMWIAPSSFRIGHLPPIYRLAHEIYPPWANSHLKVGDGL